MAEHRAFVRVRTTMEVRVESPGGVCVGLSRDLSLTGVFVPTPQPFPLGTTCRVAIPLAPEVLIEARGEIVRVTPDGMAVRFAELLGVDSYEHLRNLVLANAEDPGQAQREFAAHLGIKP